MAFLEVEKFSRGYGEIVAVRDLSFTIEPARDRVRVFVRLWSTGKSGGCGGI